MGVHPLGKIMVIAGIVLTLVGGLLMLSDKIPFLGKLPGDITVQKENFEFRFPITTCIVLSLFLSLVVWLITQSRGK
jgi:hypothetical protein